jgi:hypothetical protein
MSKYFLLIQEASVWPGQQGRMWDSYYVKCSGVKECLDLVEEGGQTLDPESRMTMVEKVPGREHMEPLRTWRVKSGQKLKSYVMNSRGEDEQLELMRSARNAFISQDATKAEVVEYLMHERGASRQDAFFAASAGLILARGEGYKPNPLSKAKTTEIIERMIAEDKAGGPELDSSDFSPNPLKRGWSPQVIWSNVRLLTSEGRPRKQALAIAFSSARKSYRGRHPRGRFPSHLEKP